MWKYNMSEFLFRFQYAKTQRKSARIHIKEMYIWTVDRNSYDCNKSLRGVFHQPRLASPMSLLEHW